MSEIPGLKFTKFSLNELSRNHIEKNVNLERPSSVKPDADKGTSKFAEMLKDGINEVNEVQKTADKMSTDLATGKNLDIHETMLAVSQAELTFNLMVQVRNKALEAYQEIMRMPI